MTRIKLCGMKRLCDIEYANALQPDYVGFVLSKGFRRTVTTEQAREMRAMLASGIIPVGVFVNEDINNIKQLLCDGIISAVQLHGDEDEDYIKRLAALTDKPIIKAFTISCADDLKKAKECAAEHILLDSGKGSGEMFDHSLLETINRPYFLAGGLSPENVRAAVEKLRPFAVDASSSLETDGVKDKQKMTDFVNAVRKADKDGK